MTLCQHDRDFSIRVGREELMTSRRHESELALGRLGCERLARFPHPTVLVGGLGMGYTLRAALDVLPPGATVIVAEFLDAVVEWNRQYLGELAGHPLQDPRVTVLVQDVFDVIQASPDAFDAILLDVDNGPHAMTQAGNYRLYGARGIQAAFNALHRDGSLAIWSAVRDLVFERLLQEARLCVRTYCLPAYAGSKAHPHRVWVVARGVGSLPTAPAAPERRPARPAPPPRPHWRRHA